MFVRSAASYARPASCSGTGDGGGGVDLELDRALDLGADRDQVVGATALDPVAGVVEETDRVAARAAEPLPEALDFGAHRRDVGVGDQAHVEAHRLQRPRHQSGVVAGIGERGDVLRIVAAIADHQSHTLHRRSARGRAQHDHQRGRKRAPPGVMTIPYTHRFLRSLPSLSRSGRSLRLPRHVADLDPPVDRRLRAVPVAEHVVPHKASLLPVMSSWRPCRLRGLRAAFRRPTRAVPYAANEPKELTVTTPAQAAAGIGPHDDPAPVPLIRNRKPRQS